MKPLAGKVVLLTGASRGLGVDMARAFAAKGCRLSLAARSAEDLETVRKTLAVESIATPADVRDRASLKALVERTESQLGPVDVLVNNAGIEAVCDFESEDLAEIEAIVATNVTGLMWLTRLVLPGMIERRSGHVCNISSLAGLNMVPHNAVYSATKHAVVGFSKSLRAEMTDHGVEVTAVCPSFVDAGMFAEWGREAPRTVPAVTASAVARAVIDTVEKNRAVVPVGKGIARIGHWFGVIAPDFSAATARRMGFLDYMREQASITAERSKR